jgi:hypothetical protein
MTRLRSSEVALRRGDYESLLSIDRLFVFRRFTADRNIVIVLNAGNEMVHIKFDTHSEHHSWLNYFTGETIQVQDQKIELDLIPATSALIFISQ